MKMNSLVLSFIGMSFVAFVGAAAFVQLTKSEPEQNHSSVTKADDRDSEKHAHAEGEHDDTEPAHEDGEEETHAKSPAEENDHAHAGEGEDGHGHGNESEEENSAVGPEKGIVKADKNLGFQLSDSAKKTFKLETVPAVPGQAMALPASAIFYGLQERNIFRVRGGFIKRVDFKFISNTKTQAVVQIDDLRPGDSIVTSGLGFLRIAELAASGGGAVGHAH